MAIPESDAIDSTRVPSAADRIADALRHAAHVFHQARLVKSMARDASEEGLHAVKRVARRMRRWLEALEDLESEATRYVKRQPFKSLGIAFGVGLQLGMLIAWLGSRFGQRRRAWS